MLSVFEEHRGSQWGLNAVSKGEKDGRWHQESGGGAEDRSGTGVGRNRKQAGLHPSP